MKNGENVIGMQNVAMSCDHLVFEIPVQRLEKDWDWTRPRLEKTGPAVQSFGFWE